MCILCIFFSSFPHPSTVYIPVNFSPCHIWRVFFPLRWSKTASLVLVGSIAQSLRRRWWGFIRVLCVEGRRQDAVRAGERIEWSWRGRSRRRRRRKDLTCVKKQRSVFDVVLVPSCRRRSSFLLLCEFLAPLSVF